MRLKIQKALFPSLVPEVLRRDARGFELSHGMVNSRNHANAQSSIRTMNWALLGCCYWRNSCSAS
jgi:hypothetical protein